jgi:hypothetical protein
MCLGIDLGDPVLKFGCEGLGLECGVSGEV